MGGSATHKFMLIQQSIHNCWNCLDTTRHSFDTSSHQRSPTFDDERKAIAIWVWCDLVGRGPGGKGKGGGIVEGIEHGRAGASDLGGRKCVRM